MELSRKLEIYQHHQAVSFALKSSFSVEKGFQKSLAVIETIH